MPARPIEDDVLRATVEAYQAANCNQVKAAHALGIARQTLQSRLHKAASRGLLGTGPVLPGFRISKTTAVLDENGYVTREFVQQRPETGDEFRVPQGHLIKGVSALLDADGRELVKWVKTREGQLDPLEVAEWLKGAFADLGQSASPAAPPADTSGELLTLYPFGDWHIGLHVWGREAGVDWDLKIAEAQIGAAVDEVINRSPRSNTAIILGGGDLLHADNQENRTSRSGHALDVDGRYPKVVETAGRIKVRTIDAALRRHERVIVRILPGNHDEHSAIAVAYFLLAWYRNEPRVTVDVSPGLFFWHRFGLNLIGATHGHTVKMEQMPGIMAHRRAEDWGATKFRYVHVFHVHHKRRVATEGDGVICESHQAPVPQDAWHVGSGFLSGRSISSATYHERFGEIGRVRVAVLDA